MLPYRNTTIAIIQYQCDCQFMFSMCSYHGNALEYSLSCPSLLSLHSRHLCRPTRCIKWQWCWSKCCCWSCSGCGHGWSLVHLLPTWSNSHSGCGLSLLPNKAKRYWYQAVLFTTRERQSDSYGQCWGYSTCIHVLSRHHRCRWMHQPTPSCNIPATLLPCSISRRPCPAARLPADCRL